MKNLVVIAVRLPNDVAAAYHARALMQGISASACIREVLALDVSRTGEMPEPRVMVLKPVKLPPKPESETPYSLFTRGYSANQIAAVLRMPYRDVLASIGKRVDAMKVGH